MTRKATRVSMAASAGCLILGRRSIQDLMSAHSSLTPTMTTLVLSALSVLLGFLAVADTLRTPLTFAWNCFVKPFTGEKGTDGKQQGRLDAFYAGQAHIYDTTRTHLLKGRETMLQLLAAHLRAQPESTRDSKPKIFVDIGGGTGWNIEKLDEYLPLTYFDKIYLVDLCEPLLEVARQRFAAKGYKNVHVLCQDASRFVLPEWESGELDPRGSITAITLSYSLSMIPAFYQMLDRCDQVLDPKRGLMGVVDFYTSRDRGIKERAIGTQSKQMSWFAKWFWECWFEMDNVHLHGSRREYLEYKMGTIKTYNARNNFLNSHIIKIPYYIFLGCSRRRDASTSAKSFELEAGNKIGMGQGGLLTPLSPFSTPSPVASFSTSTSPTMKGVPPVVPDFFSLGPSALPLENVKDGYVQTIEDVGAPLSPFHYQLRKSWRVPYMEEKIHESFRTHIYGWTWEDPDVDIKKLNLNSEDKVLCITSAGDVCLSYALNARCKTIHAVDMNPCQGHILELKLAAIQALEYHDFWLIFGEGRHPQFDRLLTSKLSPFLSSHAFAYWKTHADQFSRNFYFRGYSGWALRLAQIAFALAGVRGSVAKLCSAGSVEEQERIWKSRLRPVLLNKVMVKGFLGNPFFNWHALGVPKNQMNCFLADGTVEDFITATLDPIPGLSKLKDDNYFYLLCLNGRYTRSSCPAYLKPEGFQVLKTSKLTQAFKLHTDTILNVLRGLPDGSLTKVIVMDSMDWFDPIPPSTPLPSTPLPASNQLLTPEMALETLRSELDYEILEIRRVLAVGGHAVWRSAGKYPWYRQRFELAGFKVEPIDIREDGKAIDRVNMYASFWRAEKM